MYFVHDGVLEATVEDQVLCEITQVYLAFPLFIEYH